MWYILYDVNIHYKLDTEFKVRSFTLFARDEDNAKNIAEEMFYIETGRFSPQMILAKPHAVKEDIAKIVLHIANLHYKELSTALSGLDYRSFLNFFLAYNGFGLALGNTKRFLLEFKPVCVKVEFNTLSSVSSEFIRVEYDERVYVVKDLEHVYIARGE